MLPPLSDRCPDGRRLFPAADRNKGPILEVLRRVLPERGLVLEIASGTGQHVAHFARWMPALTWQPTDPDADMRDSIAAWIAHEGLANVLPPQDLDATSCAWPVERADAVLCINMIHIAPWAAAEGLFRGAARVLGPGGVLVLYGPYRRFGRHTAPSNAAFDADLGKRNPEWGLRDVEVVEDLARRAGLEPDEVVPMPANNVSLLFHKV